MPDKTNTHATPSQPLSEEDARRLLEQEFGVKPQGPLTVLREGEEVPVYYPGYWVECLAFHRKARALNLPDLALIPIIGNARA